MWMNRSASHHSGDDNTFSLVKSSSSNHSKSKVKFWIVGGSTEEQSSEKLFASLKQKVASHSHVLSDICFFDVPLNLKYGTFDDLIKSVDELAKHDTYTESVVKRIEKQAYEINHNAQLNIAHQRNSMSVEQYMHRFIWDDSKYTRTRSIRDNMEIILAFVTKIDNEIRVKNSIWHETKNQSDFAAKKDNQSLLYKNLVEVLTPAVVDKDDFINTEHLTTLVVCVARGLEKEWQSTYEKLDKLVVPRSTRKFDVTDKDHNTLWKVIVFKSAVDSFIAACKSRRFIVRNFAFSEDSYKKSTEEKSRQEAEKTKQEAFLNKICIAAYSNVFVAWMHIKAMRIFCEAILRFGLPAKFAAFTLSVRDNGGLKKIKKDLEAVFTSKNSFMKHFLNVEHMSDEVNGSNDQANHEEFLSYISLIFSPFAD